MAEVEAYIGQKIEEVAVLGEERDGSNAVVGAELFLKAYDHRVTPVLISKFTLQVMTKDYFAASEVKDILSDLARVPDSLEEAEAIIETRPPYVLNDKEITDEVVRRKFLYRTIEADLAASLWPLEDDPTDY